MDVTVTVIATASSTTADLTVTSPDTAPAAALVEALRTAVGAGPADSLSIDGRPVCADGLVTDCGLTDGAVIDVGDGRRPVPTASTDLTVSSGPDAGRRLALTDGEHVVGRDRRSALRIEDRSVSRQHLLLSVVAGATTVTDLGSANGTTLDGAPLVAHCATPLPVGAVLRLGDSEARRLSAGPPVSSGDRDTIHRAPRLRAPAQAVEVAFPPMPTAPPRTRVPVLAAVVPLVAGAVLAVVLHQWQFLAFTALSPIMILGQAASDRRSARRTSQLGRREFADATIDAHRRLAAALQDERRRRHNEAPDLAALTSAASTHLQPLWQRAADDSDAAVLRLGRGDLTSDIRVVGGSGTATVADVPVCVSMSEVGVLGICGPRRLMTGLARALLVQAATLHSPEQLRIVVLAPGNAQDWAWLRWLPHLVASDHEDCTAMVGFDDEQVAARVAELLATRTEAALPGEAGRGSRPTLVVVDGTASTRSSPALAALTERGDNTFVIWCAEDERELPGSCRAVAQLLGSARPTLLLTHRDQHGQTEVVPDLMGADVAEATARALAPLRDAMRSTSRSLPVDVRWIRLADLDLREHRLAVPALARHWSHGPSATLALGTGPDGDVTIDLCRTDRTRWSQARPDRARASCC